VLGIDYPIDILRSPGTMISTRDMSLLPDVDGLRHTLQSMALLDAILCPDWAGRYYSFNCRWSPGAQLGSMRNGSGDDFFAHFSAAGCWLKGFAHEYPLSPYRDGSRRVWPGVLDEVPAEFAACLREPAFSVSDVTFCIWRRSSEETWQIGHIQFPAHHPDPDGSEFLLSILDGNPETYQAWAEDYFERDVALAAVQQIYRSAPLSGAIVRQLNPDISLAELATDIREVGYPLAEAGSP
jgi:hypothetical protein